MVSLCRPFHPHTVLGQHKQEEGEDVNFAEPGGHTDTRRQNERVEAAVVVLQISLSLHGQPK